MTDARDPAEAPDSAEGVQADRPDALAVATDELLPLTRMLVELAKEEGQADQLAFFEIIHRGIENARDPDDLAGPFMELSTSAFRGFAFSPPVTFLLDQVLATAQQLSLTLSAPGGEPH